MRDIWVSVVVRGPQRSLQPCRISEPEAGTARWKPITSQAACAVFEARHPAWLAGDQVRLRLLAAAGCRLGARIPAGVSGWPAW